MYQKSIQFISKFEYYLQNAIIKTKSIVGYQNNFFIVIFLECYFVNKRHPSSLKQEQKQQQQQILFAKKHVNTSLTFQFFFYLTSSNFKHFILVELFF